MSWVCPGLCSRASEHKRVPTAVFVIRLVSVHFSRCDGWKSGRKQADGEKSMRDGGSVLVILQRVPAS